MLASPFLFFELNGLQRAVILKEWYYLSSVAIMLNSTVATASFRSREFKKFRVKDPLEVVLLDTKFKSIHETSGVLREDKNLEVKGELKKNMFTHYCICYSEPIIKDENFF